MQNIDATYIELPTGSANQTNALYEGATGVSNPGVKPTAETTINYGKDQSSSGIFDSIDKVGGAIVGGIADVIGAVGTREADRISGKLPTDSTGAPGDQAGSSFDMPEKVGGIPTNYLMIGALALAAIGVTIYLARS